LLTGASTATAINCSSLALRGWGSDAIFSLRQTNANIICHYPIGRLGGAFSGFYQAYFGDLPQNFVCVRHNDRRTHQQNKLNGGQQCARQD
jgi:hypothetical protein